MRKYKYAFVLFALTAFKTIYAQKPANDAAWILQSSLSDEFDTTALRAYKWNPTWWGGNIFNGAEISKPTNVIFNGSTLKIKADTLSLNYFESDTTKLVYGFNSPNQGLTFAYQGGVLQSSAATYKFGYLEFYAKFPSKKWPLWMGFWLFGSSGVPGSKYLNEIDITENDGPKTFAGNFVGNNYHISDTTNDYNKATNFSSQTAVLAPGDSLSGAFHKYAFEWDPDKMIFYFDGQPTLIVNDTTGKLIPQNPMLLIINFCIDPWYAYLPADWNNPKIFGNPTIHGDRRPTKWHQYFEVEYVRYYKLTTDCGTALNNMCTPAGYDRKVKKSISTDNICTPTFSPSNEASSYVLRATDYILLNEGTTINPSGTGYFAMETMACPQ